MNKNFFSTLIFIAVFTAAFSSRAETVNTGKGKIVFTQGHFVPSCRTVKFLHNETGLVSYFRIGDYAGSGDIQSVILSALISSRDVVIVYDPNVTTGCGTEPKIRHITVF